MADESGGGRRLGHALGIVVAGAIGLVGGYMGIRMIDGLGSGRGSTCAEMQDDPKRLSSEARTITRGFGVYDLPPEDCDQKCRDNFTASMRRELVASCRGHSGDYRPRKRIETEAAD